jgi:hypothetical protein
MEYYNEGDYASAVASMLSDMKKHPKTALGTLDSTLMYLGNIYVRNNDSLRVKRWIEGFN